MTLHRTFWQAAEMLSEGLSVRLVVVASNTTHSPGTAGAAMVFDVGRAAVFGTIGGGIMEADYIARVGTFDSAPRLEKLVHRKNAKDNELASGLFCAGEQTILSFGVDPGSDAHVSIVAFVDAISTHRESRLIVTGSGLGLVDGAGEKAIDLATDGKSFSVAMSALNFRRVVIAGGGHCGLALSRTMASVGYDVTVYDTRESQRSAFTDERVLFERTEMFEDVGGLVQNSSATDLVVMTSNVVDDIAVLRGASEFEFKSVGVMGSVAKIARIKSELQACETSDNFIDNLNAPIGLPMKSDTPEEIAVSIAAEILTNAREISVEDS